MDFGQRDGIHRAPARRIDWLHHIADGVTRVNDLAKLHDNAVDAKCGSSESGSLRI